MIKAFSSTKLIVLVLSVLIALPLASISAFGQAISGDLAGNVFDKSGAAVGNADIVILNENTGFKVTTKANDKGEFRAGNLPVGAYSLTASAATFRSSTIAHFNVELSKTSTVTFALEPGMATETVEVSAAPPAIDTTTAQISGSFDVQQIQDLPTASIGLGVLNLALLQPGVASTGGLGAGSGPSVGGQRPRNNNFTIEGVDDNDKGVTGPVVTVPNDAVQEFATLQNQFSPEFGHSTGGQFNVVLVNGTNSFHGRAYEYLQNRKLDGVDTSLALQGTKTNPRFDNNRFGGELGGPVIKNKLFFFGSYEYNPIGQATAPASAVLAPTAAGYTQLLGLTGLSINSTSITQLQKYAVASTSGGSLCASQANTSGPGSTGAPACDDPTHAKPGEIVNIDVGTLSIVAPNFINNRAYIGSMDYNISDRDQVRARYINNKQVALDTAALLPIFYTSNPVESHLATVAEFHTFSPAVANEFRVGFLRTGFNITVPGFKWPGLDAFPNITLQDAGLGVGPDGNGPQGSTQNVYSATDNLTWTRGSHSFKFGVEGRKYISPQVFIQRSRGDYNYSTLDHYVHDFVPDGLAERSFGNVGYNGNQKAIYWYINDNWKVSSNLTLNLGLRYEYTSTPFGWTQQSLNSVADVPGLITFRSPQAPKKDFGPRVGFAYSPGTKGDWAFRGGFGVGYDVLYDNIGVLSRPPQIGSTVDCPGGAGCGVDGSFLANGGIVSTGQSGITVLDRPTALANTSSYLPNNVKYPYSIQWNLGVQHTFGSYTAEVRYVGTRGVHLNVQNRIDIVSVVTPAQNLPVYTTAPSQATLDALTTFLGHPGPVCTGLRGQLSCQHLNIDAPYLNAGFGGPIVGFLPYGSSTYHGLSGQITRRFTKGLQFQGGYTYSKDIDNSTADFFSTVVNPRRPQDFRNLQAERGNSALDHRHRLTFSLIYNVPWFNKSNWAARNLLGNWEIAPVYIYESGGWGSVQSSTDVNLNGDSAGDRAFFNPKGRPGTGAGVTGLTNSVTGETVAYLINPLPDGGVAQYNALQRGAIANSSRNTLRGPGINNWDITAQKKISITERMNLAFGAQFFNAFNHPQYIPGSLNTINSISQTSGGVKNYLTPGATDALGNNLFNVAKVAFASNARVGQLFLKFTF